MARKNKNNSSPQKLAVSDMEIPEAAIPVRHPWTKAIIGALGVAAGIVGGVYAYRAYQLQVHTEEKRVAKLYYSVVPFLDSPGSPTWGLALSIGNLGPSATSTVLVDYYCPSEAFNRKCDIRMVSKPATATAEIIPRSTPGHNQLVLRQLSPADGVTFQVTYRSSDDLRKLYAEYAGSERKSVDFTRKYIGQLRIHGEYLSLVNTGLVKGLLGESEK
jgi:hypothetical protein